MKELILEKIMELKGTSLVSYTEKVDIIKEEDTSEEYVKFFIDPSILYIFINNNIAMDNKGYYILVNKNTRELLIKDDNTNALYLDLKTQYVEIEEIEGKDSINIQIKDFTYDVIDVNKEEDILNYPLFNIEILNLVGNLHRCIIKMKINPFQEPLIIDIEEGYLETILAELPYKMNRFKSNIDLLYSLFLQEDQLLYINGFLYEKVEILDNIISLTDYLEGSISKISIKDFIMDSYTNTIGNKDIFKYKNQWFNVEEILQGDVDELFGDGLNECIFYKLYNIYNLILKSQINELEVSIDLINNFNVLMDKLINSGILETKVSFAYEFANTLFKFNKDSIFNMKKTIDILSEKIQKIKGDGV